jgi:hypothetical protein
MAVVNHGKHGLPSHTRHCQAHVSLHQALLQNMSRGRPGGGGGGHPTPHPMFLQAVGRSVNRFHKLFEAGNEQSGLCNLVKR